MLAQMENKRHCREVRRRDRTDECKSASHSDMPGKRCGKGGNEKEKWISGKRVVRSQIFTFLCQLT